MRYLPQRTNPFKIKSKRFHCHFADCKKGFPTLKDLRRHWVVHTGSREYKCSYCNDFFGRRDHKLRHENKCHLRSKFKQVPDHNVSSVISGNEDKGITDTIREKPSQVTHVKRCTNQLSTTPTPILPRYNCTSA